MDRLAELDAELTRILDEIAFEVDGQPVTLRAGQVAVIPGGVPHGARVIASESVITDNYIASANRTPLQFDGSNS